MPTTTSTSTTTTRVKPTNSPTTTATLTPSTTPPTTTSTPTTTTTTITLTPTTKTTTTSMPTTTTTSTATTTTTVTPTTTPSTTTTLTESTTPPTTLTTSTTITTTTTLTPTTTTTLTPTTTPTTTTTTTVTSTSTPTTTSTLTPPTTPSTTTTTPTSTTITTTLTPTSTPSTTTTSTSTTPPTTRSTANTTTTTLTPTTTQTTTSLTPSTTPQTTITTFTTTTTTTLIPTTTPTTTAFFTPSTTPPIPTTTFTAPTTTTVTPTTAMTKTTTLTPTNTPTATTSTTTTTTTVTITSTPTTTTTLTPSNTPTKTKTTTTTTTTTLTTTTTFTTTTTTTSLTPTTTPPTTTTVTPTTTPIWTTSTTTTLTPTTTPTPSSPYVPTTKPCECNDIKKNKIWPCGTNWTEDCRNNTCEEGKIVSVTITCPELEVPSCPRKDMMTKVTDGCCEKWECDCVCELYGDPHYISFGGVNFDFMDNCTYVLVEELHPVHNLTIAVDNYYCMPDIRGSCVKGIILKYKMNTVKLNIVEENGEEAVKVTLNSETIQPPYEQDGLKFETTEIKVFVHIPEIRSFISLTPYNTLVVSLAMEKFQNKVQGQCGECGAPASCVRRGGIKEDDTCCHKTSYSWVYNDPNDPQKPSCPPTTPPCFEPTTTPTITPATTTPCPNQLCDLLEHQIFAECRKNVSLTTIEKNCRFDGCNNKNASCSSLEKAAEDCKNAGFCVNWRNFTDGMCGKSLNVQGGQASNSRCPEGLVYEECRQEPDPYCVGGELHKGDPLISVSAGCFCPKDYIRSSQHSKTCVKDCGFCKGPYGEPKLPGEKWVANCFLCECDNQTLTEKCTKIDKDPPICKPNEILVNESCCYICVERTCIYQGKTYKVGEHWNDTNYPCMSLNCTLEGVKTEKQVCTEQTCPEEDRVWDDQKCCFTCTSSKQTCSPSLTNITATVDNCTAVIEVPVCKGQCYTEASMMGNGVMHQDCKCCQKQTSEKRNVNLKCQDKTTKSYNYEYIKTCSCEICNNK